jgi:hypothetical protein
MLENQELPVTDRISSRPPLHSDDQKPNEPEKKNWWNRQTLSTKVITVILGIVALFIVTEVLEQAERIIYQVFKIGIWVFAAFVVIVVVRSVFKKS